MVLSLSVYCVSPCGRAITICIPPIQVCLTKAIRDDGLTITDCHRCKIAALYEDSSGVAVGSHGLTALIWARGSGDVANKGNIWCSMVSVPSVIVFNNSINDFCRCLSS